jgi:hypothetical protein
VAQHWAVQKYMLELQHLFMGTGQLSEDGMHDVRAIWGSIKLRNEKHGVFITRITMDSEYACQTEYPQLQTKGVNHRKRLPTLRHHENQNALR